MKEQSLICCQYTKFILLFDVMHQRPTYAKVAEKVEKPIALHIIAVYTLYVPDANISIERYNATSFNKITQLTNT